MALERIFSLVIVVAAHVGLLFWMTMGLGHTPPQVVPPTIQGVLVPGEALTPPQPLPTAPPASVPGPPEPAPPEPEPAPEPPPPEPKPKPKPRPKPEPPPKPKPPSEKALTTPKPEPRPARPPKPAAAKPEARTPGSAQNRTRPPTGPSGPPGPPLVSVGSTAPFIGLFGTVWGIYHALVSIGVSGQASIDKVAGPVGEALIMTAFGLAVAIPAVLGYNLLIRANKGVLGQLNRFAHQLHSYFLTGAPVNRPALRVARIVKEAR